MTVEIFNVLKTGGFIITAYTFSASLGVLKASILGQIISEFNHAQNNNLAYGNDFLFSPKRMSRYLGLTEDVLIKELYALAEINLIEVYESYISDTMYMRVNQQEIINFKTKVETEYMLGAWNDGLLRCQNPIHKPTKFCNSVEQIKQYLYDNMAEPDKIPLVLYSYASDVIEGFENKTGLKILNYSNTLKNLNMIAKSEAPRELFESYVEKFNVQEA